MSKISLRLEQNLRRLNPHLILESDEFEENERHRVRTWLEILPWSYLQRESSMESDIYNDGRLEIKTRPPEGFYHISMYEPAVTEFRKRLR